ncbi:MAG: alkaline phosphatase family protein [Deltaproteobacteria bacterium]|nr:alkaline phosphatase family protein [Deltaproteobacteria bacterium]
MKRLAFFLASLATLVASSAHAARPKLVVLLVVDQMRADYIDSYGAAWKGGLHRLTTQGAYFTNAAYPYLQTITCAGHATVSTGSYPYAHGMVQNAWFDRASGKSVTCTEDAGKSLISYGTPVPGGDSAQRLLVPSLADEMRAQLFPAPRVVTLSLKARSAIMMAGHGGTSVAWTDGGALVTSRAFAQAPVPALTESLKRLPIAWDKVPAWTPLLPPKAYAFADDAPEEHSPSGWTRTFPHKLQGASVGETMANWTRSPYADEYFGNLAIEMVKAMKLGQGPGADFLGVSFSVLDLVGHAYGPRSHEVQDVLARLDVTLGHLLAALDQAVGKNNYVVALTADHGVSPLPEQVTPTGVSAGRLPFARLKADLEAAIAKEVGGQNNVAAMVYTDLYLGRGVYGKLAAKPGALERVLAAVRKVPGIAAAFAADQLLTPKRSDGELQYAAQLSYHPERSGDIVIVPAPYWIAADAGTTHGTANGYDQRVPIIFMGAGIKAGRQARRVSPADIAPSLGHILGVTLSHADGEVLPELQAAH